MGTEIYIDPTREAFDFFKSLPRDTPIEMLNLVRFNDLAQYPADHEYAAQGLTGAQAYSEYAKYSSPIFTRVGGKNIWSGDMEAVLTGPVDEKWDAAFIAAYPNSGAFFEMVTDSDYRMAVVHRQAAVLTSRLIRFAPKTGFSQSFG